MEERNIWVIEQVKLEDGEIAQRQSVATFNEHENGSWSWVCPKDRLDEAGIKEWDRILGVLKDVNGEDLRHLVCGVGLMDHCNNPKSCDQYVD